MTFNWDNLSEDENARIALAGLAGTPIKRCDFTNRKGQCRKVSRWQARDVYFKRWEKGSRWKGLYGDDRQPRKDLIVKETGHVTVCEWHLCTRHLESSTMHIVFDILTGEKLTRNDATGSIFRQIEKLHKDTR